jgi:hypothetical protein
MVMELPSISTFASNLFDAQLKMAFTCFTYSMLPSVAFNSKYESSDHAALVVDLQPVFEKFFNPILGTGLSTLAPSQQMIVIRNSAIDSRHTTFFIILLF